MIITHLCSNIMKHIALIYNAGHTSQTVIENICKVVASRNLSFCDNVQNADLVLSIGGDGTFLSAAAAVADSGTPILGINTGHLGFLTDISQSELADALDRIKSQDYILHPRSVISVEAIGSEIKTHPHALNEVAILKHDNSALIQIETYINGQLLNGYLADGLIISTPTGSTGYSLSVGGPIAAPDCGCLCLSAVAPHSLNVRPVILRDDVDIELRIHSRSHHYLLAIDGRSQSLPHTTTLRLRRASFNINVMNVHHRAFFDTLRDKMHWGIDAR